jgi:hypothetical protein
VHASLEICRHLVGSSCMPVYNQLVQLVPHHVMEEGRSSELCRVGTV